MVESTNSHLIKDVHAACDAAKRMAQIIDDEGVAYLSIGIGGISVTVKRLDRPLTGVPNIHIVHQDVER